MTKKSKDEKLTINLLILNGLVIAISILIVSYRISNLSDRISSLERNREEQSKFEREMLERKILSNYLDCKREQPVCDQLYPEAAEKVRKAVDESTKK